MTAKIICPHCGAEYLIEEIFMGEDVIGTRVAIKDSNTGKILHADGDAPELSAEYICDYCDTKFVTKLKVEVASVEKFVDDFDEEYKVEIHKNRIELAE